MPQEYYKRDFPNLNGRFRQTSDIAFYNCIAYLVGDERRRWWPGEYPGWSADDYWPDGIPWQDETIEVFAAALATEGYLPCENGSLEPGFEKVVLYLLAGKVTHGARQMDDGTWRSKLGPNEDIEHPLDGLEGPAYGTLGPFFKRPRKGFRQP